MCNYETEQSKIFKSSEEDFEPKTTYFFYDRQYVILETDEVDYQSKLALTRGAKGDDVAELQEKLIDEGYDLGSWGADGSYGPATERAVKQYQEDHNLTVDGMTGNETWGSLLDEDDSSSSSSNTNSSSDPYERYIDNKYEEINEGLDDTETVYNDDDDDEQESNNSTNNSSNNSSDPYERYKNRKNEEISKGLDETETVNYNSSNGQDTTNSRNNSSSSSSQRDIVNKVFKKDDITSILINRWNSIDAGFMDILDTLIDNGHAHNEVDPETVDKINIDEGDINSENIGVPNGYNDNQKAQFYLSEMGFDIGTNEDGSPDIDGLWGNNSTRQMLRFQYAMGYELTGLADDDSIRLLEEAMEKGWTAEEITKDKDLVISERGFIQMPEPGSNIPEYKHYTLPDDDNWMTPATFASLMRVLKKWNDYRAEEKTKGNEIPLIQIGDISHRNGGYIYKHESHRDGIDIDTRPIRNDMTYEYTNIYSDTYSHKLTEKFIKILLSDSNVSKVKFNDKEIIEKYENVIYWEDHHHHLHIDFKQ
ncbi:MAG: peptidoglycan-binding protein [Firmicutes bacterium]|nr:peptidoglycan-binding protein [Bacillota bacterium]